MGQDDVEVSVEVQGAHVALDVEAARVQAPGNLQHGGAEVGQGAVEVRLQVEGHMPAAAAQLQQGPCMGSAGLQDATNLRALSGIVGDGGDHGPPVGETIVEDFHGAP